MSEFRRRLLYSKKKEALNYLCFTALEEGTFTFTYHASLTANQATSVSYSIDGGLTWVTLNHVPGTAATITTPTINTGETVLWRGTNNALGYRTNPGTTAQFSSTGTFDVSGNVGSILYGDKFNGKSITAQYGLPSLFYNCKIVNAKDLTLIPFTAYHAYPNMFQNCTNLITPPLLPFTSLQAFCYTGMFYGCTSLETAPVLPATTVSSYAYNQMFRYCSKLRYIKAMFLTDPAESTSAFQNWVQGVAASGTFVKNAAAEWDVTGNGGIPSGWTVETANS